MTPAVMNQLGLCMSYDKLERIEIGIAKHTIDMAGDYRASIPPVILSSKGIHGAMGNFDHKGNIRVLAAPTMLKRS